jgi:cholesterol oxidase
MPDVLEAVVIGTGFGGGINACRLSKRWPGKVLVFERGKRYAMGAFPRTPHDFAHNFWNLPWEGRARPARMRETESHGMFDVRNFRKMDAVLCAGVGGGSLIYANVFLEPPDGVFDDRWPASTKRATLSPYYAVAKQVLGARPVPRDDNDPRRRIARTELFRRVAEKNGRTSHLLDINVFFGNDFDRPTPIGHQDRNRYGALQTSCVYCAECDAGCNHHSKNTIDLNYLYVAEQRYHAEVRTEHLATQIVPVNAKGEDDLQADGSYGYRVGFIDLTAGRATQSVLANRVVVSAGTLGSGELLLRCKRDTLPRLSERLGHRFSGNGDFLGFVIGTKPVADPNYGPVITQGIDYNLLENFDRDRAFILEDASYPAFLAWFVEGVKPGVFRLGAIGRTIRAVWDRFTGDASTGSLGYALGDLLSGDLSHHTAVLLSMGVDKSNGILTLDANGCLDLNWPTHDSMPLYEAIENANKAFRDATAAPDYIPLPTWLWPLRKNVTVHLLGGCVLADDASNGVTSADRATFGQAFGYRNLFVADGAIVPTAVGANPIATISALSEMVAEGITGIAPTADL